MLYQTFETIEAIVLAFLEFLKNPDLPLFRFKTLYGESIRTILKAPVAGKTFALMSLTFDNMAKFLRRYNGYDDNVLLLGFCRNESHDGVVFGTDLATLDFVLFEKSQYRYLSAMHDTNLEERYSALRPLLPADDVLFAVPQSNPDNAVVTAIGARIKQLSDERVPYTVDFGNALVEEIKDNDSKNGSDSYSHYVAECVTAYIGPSNDDNAARDDCPYYITEFLPDYYSTGEHLDALLTDTDAFITYAAEKFIAENEDKIARARRERYVKRRITELFCNGPVAADKYTGEHVSGINIEDIRAWTAMAKKIIDATTTPPYDTAVNFQLTLERDGKEVSVKYPADRLRRKSPYSLREVFERSTWVCSRDDRAQLSALVGDDFRIADILAISYGKRTLYRRDGEA